MSEKPKPDPKPIPPIKPPPSKRGLPTSKKHQSRPMQLKVKETKTRTTKQ